MSISYFGSLTSLTSSLEESFKLIVLGFVQGVTEFLPISSTAHIKVISVILGWGDPGIATSAFIQIGSLLAVISYFQRDLKSIFKVILKVLFKGQLFNPAFGLASSLLISSLPIVFAGMCIKIFWTDYENSIFRSIPSIALVSIFMGLLLAYAEKKGKRTKSFQDINILDGLKIGLAQVFALLPGVSRSGVTITAALMGGWQRDSAARFCFLLGIPAITLSALVELKSAIHSEYTGGLFPLSLGVLSATITSWFAIDFLMRFLRKNTTMIFVWYRIIFGLLVLAWWYLLP